MEDLRTIVYDYHFNYFGKDTHDGKTITGANVSLAIHAYKNGKEVNFENGKEPTTNGRYFNEVFKVKFDRQKLFVVERNLHMDNLFRLVFGFDKIDYEIVEYSLDYLEGTSKECFPDLKLPKEFENMPVSTLTEVNENEFKAFLSEHIDDFDISDNKNAQCLSVSFIEKENNEAEINKNNDEIQKQEELNKNN